MAHEPISPLLVVVGATASGKSGLAMQLAQQYDGEIIAADSRTIYQGMDIGTAKPAKEDRDKVPHHCIDIADPSQQFSAAVFKEHALAAISDISMRGKLPILVGGTGLYVDAVLYDYSFRPSADPALRAHLNTMDVAQLQQELNMRGVPLPNNPKNPVHLIRTIETDGQTAKRKALRERTAVIGMSVEREELNHRISDRVEDMIAAGPESEVRFLSDKYGWQVPGMRTIGYQEWFEYFSGTQTHDETKQLIIRNTIAYAKRQKTWFKRNNSVQWISNREEARIIEASVTTLLNN